jgi:hypothetical protein
MTVHRLYTTLPVLGRVLNEGQYPEKTKYISVGPYGATESIVPPALFRFFLFIIRIYCIFATLFPPEKLGLGIEMSTVPNIKSYGKDKSN